MGYHIFRELRVWQEAKLLAVEELFFLVNGQCNKMRAMRTKLIQSRKLQ
jgi:hypothetical protein